jgi:hypothetical protein
MEKETLEEAAVLSSAVHFERTICSDGFYKTYQTGFKQGAKWMQERMYSEEEVKTIASKLFYSMTDSDFGIKHTYESFEKWFEQFKKN